MLRPSLNLLLLTVCFSLFAGEPGAIEGHTFLPESGWNREDRVLQYNSFLAGRASALEITSAWMAHSPRHQLSWTLPIVSNGESGFGDAMLHYRHQLVRGEHAAVASRFSVILPTRSARLGPAVRGLEIALPASFAASDHLTLHGALGARWLSDGCHELNVQNAISYSVTERAALLVDSSYTIANGSRDLVVRPAVQFSFEVGGLRVAPALALPLGGEDRSLMLLVGFEHDF